MPNHVASVVLPDVRDVQFLSDSYDTLVQSNTIMEGRFASFPRRLDLLASNVGKISKAVDEMPHYNLSIQLLDCWGTPSQRGGTCARYRKILFKAIFWPRSRCLGHGEISERHRLVHIVFSTRGVQGNVERFIQGSTHWS